MDPEVYSYTRLVRFGRHSCILEWNGRVSLVLWAMVLTSLSARYSGFFN